MDPNAQTLFNIVVSLCAMLGGWMLKSVQSSLEHLQATDMELTNKIQAIEVLVAGNYVKRDDMQKMQDAIFSKLDRIEAKIDRKVDK